MLTDRVASMSRRPIALVLAGGVALGAYEAGAYAGLHEAGADGPLSWIASSSIGSVNAAIIARTEHDRRVDALRRFWEANATDPLPLQTFWFGRPSAGPGRVAYNAAGVVETLLFGRPGLFRLRVVPGAHAGAADTSALYDLEPLRRSLEAVVDFDRLNGGAVRLSVAATDVVTGERVVFDTAKTRVGPEHILASCALLPIFAPVEVGGRLLADGGLSSNTPLDLILDEAASSEFTCLAVDLFAGEGSRPHGLAASASRAADVAFANQTRNLLEGRRREYQLRSLIGRLGDRLPSGLREDPEAASILAEARTGGAQLAFLSYRAAPDEVGLFKLFDFSRATLEDRWQAGLCDMQSALRRLEQASGDEGLRLNVEEIPASMPFPVGNPAALGSSLAPAA